MLRSDPERQQFRGESSWFGDTPQDPLPAYGAEEAAVPAPLPVVPQHKIAIRREPEHVRREHAGFGSDPGRQVGFFERLAVYINVAVADSQPIERTRDNAFDHDFVIAGQAHGDDIATVWLPEQKGQPFEDQPVSVLHARSHTVAIDFRGSEDEPADKEVANDRPEEDASQDVCLAAFWAITEIDELAWSHNLLKSSRLHAKTEGGGRFTASVAVGGGGMARHRRLEYAGAENGREGTEGDQSGAGDHGGGGECGGQASSGAADCESAVAETD